MMMMLVDGADAGVDPTTTYSYGNVDLTIRATHPEMTYGFLAWMIEGWLDLVGLYGWWEEKLELVDGTLGMLAVGTLGTANGVNVAKERV